jgi:tRNA A-37 threonylcarbamoyl transferase component Bud32
VPSIISCPNCAAIVVPQESGGICPKCRTPVVGSEIMTVSPPAGDDVTRLAQGASAPSNRPKSGSSGAGSSSRSSSSSGWLSSSGAIDHGRFEPGTLLGGRYRIIERLGRGGMGEVYRADDLKLGQPVALKFLPADVDRDPARLTQLHTEVRMARQVSHPNVCRVYDIDEVDGHTFLSMEYVDGEDLASLLRRVGRFPENRALEIARQMCAGLAAAHERGVIHRDLKPANVMLDASGKVRLTDFGLAGVAGESIRAGTPAYMAPEQLAGGEVTARSDIYALGLVLYEIFTGHRALEAANLAELIRKREQSGIAPPSAVVRELTPEIDRGIMRCLRPQPEERPASALAVAAALPGGDPLAAALAAGETPSPEMVAAAGSSEAIAVGWAAAGLAWVAVTLAALVLIDQRILLINRVPLPKPAEALTDRAQEALATLGYTTPPAATASGFAVSLDYPRYIDETSTARDRWQKLAVERPESIILWYRTSPRPLVPIGNENNVAATNPPLNVSGMALVVVDASGRLSEFHAVPEPIESEQPHGSTNWAALFAAAGIPMTAFTPVKPRWIPLVYADERAAWEGRLPNQPDITLRIDAAAYHGRPVFFSTSGPWSRSARSQPATGSIFTQVVDSIANVMMPALMVVGAVLARRNVRLERGDRVGAFRAASIVFITSLAAWLLGSTHVASLGLEITRVFAAIGVALFNAAVLWMTYLGLEPYVRRSSPDSLIGWTRLISGSWRDPHVGKDMLVGISAGLAMTLVFALYYLLPPLFGRPEPMPVVSGLRPLSGSRYVFSQLVSQITSAITSGMLGTAGIAALLMLLKRRWLAVIAAIVWFTPVVVQGMFNPGYPVLQIVLGIAIISVFIAVVIRFGLLAAIAALATHFVLLRAPLTADLTGWRGSAALWYIGVIAAAGLGACYTARSTHADRPSRAIGDSQS